MYETKDTCADMIRMLLEICQREYLERTAQQPNWSEHCCDQSTINMWKMEKCMRSCVQFTGKEKVQILLSYAQSTGCSLTAIHRNIKGHENLHYFLNQVFIDLVIQ